MVCIMDHSEYYSKIRCFRCRGGNIESFFHTGDVVCTDCGEVLASRLIDTRLEEIVYAEDRERGNTLTRSSGLGESLGSDEICFISTSNHNDALVSSLQRAKKFLSNPKEKLILGCLKDVNEACSRMHLIANIKSRCVSLVTKVLQDHVARSKEKDLVIAACIYLACRLEGYPRLIEEVSSWCFVPAEDLVKMQFKIANKLELTCPMIAAKDLVNRFVFLLGSWPHSYTYIRKAMDICQHIVDYELFPTMPPQQIAAGVMIWIALLEDFANVDVSRLCAVSHTSMPQLKAFYQLSHKMIANLVPEDLLDNCKNMSKFPVSLEKCFRDGSTRLKSSHDEGSAPTPTTAVSADSPGNGGSSSANKLSNSNGSSSSGSNAGTTTAVASSSAIRKRKTISTYTYTPVAAAGANKAEEVQEGEEEDLHQQAAKLPRRE